MLTPAIVVPYTRPVANLVARSGLDPSDTYRWSLVTQSSNGSRATLHLTAAALAGFVEIASAFLVEESLRLGAKPA